jgi:uncharacterized NAD(P)/FAD-binding protein YdhS
MPTQNTDIAIVGGGFAGVATAIKLLRQLSRDDAGNASITLSIIESRPQIGRGIAYSTDNVEHLVNGPAQLFGLYPERPSHLADWLAANAARHGWTPPDGVSFAEAFPPRWLYGTYVQEELQAALTDAAGRASLKVIRGRAVDLVPTTPGVTVVLQDGTRLTATHVVLALGLFRATGEGFLSAGERASLAERYIDDVWNDASWKTVSDDQHILLVGSSLSALDAAFNAERAGFKGTFHALSRRGLLVQRRRQNTPWPNVLDPQNLPASLRELVRITRHARRAIKQAGADWQQLPGAIRPHLPALWQHASDTDRRRFLRHLRPFWEITLHRAAPESGNKLQQYIAQGRLHQLTGRIRSLRRQGSTVEVQWTPRGSDQVQTLLVDRVVNAAGYEFDWDRIADPLVRALLRRKLVRRHATGFGIDADPATGATLSADGQPGQTLFAVGHALRGAAWESNAIGEQLDGARNTANALVYALHAVESI